MNIKPTDKLAYTVHSCEPQNSNRIVEIVRYVGFWTFGDGSTDPHVWLVKTVTPLIDVAGKEWIGNVYIQDRYLRPIRDPGEDAVDEILQLLGKPEATPIEFALQVER